MITSSVIISQPLQEGGIPDVQLIQRMARNASGKWVVQYLRVRVGEKGRGANGRLKGYSKNPLVVEENTLKKRQPAGGLPKFYPKGYWGYRRAVGLRTDRFIFTNTGYSMRSLTHRISPAAGGGDVAVFFPDPDSMNAANMAIDNNREDMFDVNDKELEQFGDEYLKVVVNDLWSEFFQ